MDKNLARKRRRQLRREMTEPEKLLWYKLREMPNTKFRRQHSISDYIVDFYCAPAALVIELDGDSHFNDEAKVADKKRDEFLTAQGLTVLRFTNEQVMRETVAVLEQIFMLMTEKNAPHPGPLLASEEREQNIPAPIKGEG